MPPAKTNHLSCSNVSTIIWDWNGTLLDDVDICVSSINLLLEKRHLGMISKERYREIFTFPVKQYYLELGFDFSIEEWDTVAMEFMGHYFEKLPSCNLHEGVADILSWLEEQGYRQAVLSAMEHESLVGSLNHFGIYHHFVQIAGIEDHYATSKHAQAKKLLSTLDVKPSDVVLIGDSLHDLEVADTLKCHCILISQGHQSKERLETTGINVLGRFNELREYF